MTPDNATPTETEPAATPDAPAGKPPSRLSAAFKKAVSRKAPWYYKVARCSLLVVALYPAFELSLMGLLQGRHLTQDERTELSQIFKESVDYDKVRIHSSKAMDIVANPLGGALTGTLTEGHTRGNVIVIPTSLAGPDYSGAYTIPEINEIATHENVHVWQFQSCPVKMSLATLMDSVNQLRGIDATYDYRLAPGKDLLDYTTEQQATMITDYFLRVAKGKIPEFVENTGKPEDLKPLYEQTLRRFKANPGYLKNNCGSLK